MLKYYKKWGDLDSHPLFVILVFVFQLFIKYHYDVGGKNVEAYQSYWFIFLVVSSNLPAFQLTVVELTYLDGHHSEGLLPAF